MTGGDTAKQGDGKGRRRKRKRSARERNVVSPNVVIDSVRFPSDRRDTGHPRTLGMGRGALQAGGVLSRCGRRAEVGLAIHETTADIHRSISRRSGVAVGKRASGGCQDTLIGQWEPEHH